MENAARIIITIFFIGLIALAIIFFGVFGLVPLEKVGRLGKGTSPETEYVSPDGNGEGGTSQNTNTGTSGSSPQNGGQNTEGNQTPPPIGEPSNGSGQVNPGTTLPSDPYIPPQKKEIKLDVPPGSPNAPQQSSPLSLSELSKDSVLISIKENAFTPPAFLIKKGEEITLAIESKDNRTHVFMFKDPSLSAIAIGVGPKEIRAITFTPPKAGEFWFYCNVPGHEGAGESGKMVVID